MWICMGGYGQFRGEWVNVDKMIFFKLGSCSKGKNGDG